MLDGGAKEAREKIFMSGNTTKFVLFHDFWRPSPADLLHEGSSSQNLL
jgi:hypothetical protein